MGPVSTAEALRRAREVNMDLVEVAPTARPPVCRIMDYGKWRYQQQKKEDKSRAAARAGHLKELKISLKIGENDLNIKVNHARQFLADGNKVQFTLQFRGREMAHQHLGREMMARVRSMLADVCKVEREAKMEGRRMVMVLQPDSHKPSKAPAKASPAAPAATQAACAEAAPAASRASAG